MSVPRRRIVPVALVMVTALVLGSCSSSASKSGSGAPKLDLASPERTLPMCSEPVGLGAKRVRTVNCHSHSIVAGGLDVMS